MAAWAAVAQFALSEIGRHQNIYANTYNEQMQKATQSIESQFTKMSTEEAISAIDREKIMTSMAVDAGVREAEANRVVSRAVMGGEAGSDATIGHIKSMAAYSERNAIKALDGNKASLLNDAYMSQFNLSLAGQQRPNVDIWNILKP